MPDRPPQPLADYLRRLTLSWLVPLALVAAALAGFSVYQVHQLQSAEVTALAQRIGDHIDADLQRRLHGLRAVAATIGSTVESGDLQDWYRQALAYDQAFGTPVLLAHRQRRMLFHTRRPLGQMLPQMPEPPARLPFDELVARQEVWVGDLESGPVMGRPVVPVVVPVDAQHAMIGMVMPSSVELLLQQQRLPEGWSATVYDGAGHPIASTDQTHLPLNAVRSALRATDVIVTTPWTVVVEAGNWPFYRPHLQVASALVLSISLAFAGAALSTRRATLALMGSVGRLADKLPHPEPHASKATARQSLPRIAEIEAARSELQRLSRARYQAEEAERSRIARELHDGIQQDVAAMHINLSVALSRLGGDTQAQEPLNAALTSAQRVLKGIQHAVDELRPPSFESGGLMVALEDLTQQFNAITGTQVELEVVGSEAQVDALPLPIADCLYRIAQECLNNVRKHAQASFVHVELDLLNEAEVCLRVADDGVGLGSTGRLKLTDFGTQSMVERANALNGALAVWHGSADEGSDGGRGTTVRVTLPL